jgi:hypothetical protein
MQTACVGQQLQSSVPASQYQGYTVVLVSKMRFILISVHCLLSRVIAADGILGRAGIRGLLQFVQCVLKPEPSAKLLFNYFHGACSPPYDDNSF